MRSVPSKENYDVIVIGGGPAGSAAAKSITDHGFKALIIEKKKVPRNKCCTGVIFGEAQLVIKEHYGEIPEAIYCEPKEIRPEDILMYKEGKPVSRWYFEYPREGLTYPEVYLNVWRDKFDQWLLEQSRAEVIDQCTFENFRDEGDEISIECRDINGNKVNLKARYLIGADGMSSRVRDRLDPDFKRRLRERGVYLCFYKFYSSNLEKERWHIFPNMGGCLYKGDFLVLTVGVGKEGSKTQLERFIKFLQEKFEVKLEELYEEQATVANDMAQTGNFFLGKGRILLSGDAAGFLYMNGEGIASALTSGFSAGKAIIESMGSGKDVLSIYSDMVATEKKHTITCWQGNDLPKRLIA